MRDGATGSIVLMLIGALSAATFVALALAIRACADLPEQEQRVIHGPPHARGYLDRREP